MGRLTKEQRDKRIKCWASGMDVVEAADLCGCSVQTLYKWMKNNGFQQGDGVGLVGKNRVTREIEDEIVTLRERQWTYKQIADLVGYSTFTVFRVLKKRST